MALERYTKSNHPLVLKVGKLLESANLLCDAIILSEDENKVYVDGIRANLLEAVAHTAVVAHRIPPKRSPLPDAVTEHRADGTYSTRWFKH